MQSSHVRSRAFGIVSNAVTATTASAAADPCANDNALASVNTVTRANKYHYCPH